MGTTTGFGAVEGMLATGMLCSLTADELGLVAARMVLKLLLLEVLEGSISAII